VGGDVDLLVESIVTEAAQLAGERESGGDCDGGSPQVACADVLEEVGVAEIWLLFRGERERRERLIHVSGFLLE